MREEIQKNHSTDACLTLNLRIEVKKKKFKQHQQLYLFANEN